MADITSSPKMSWEAIAEVARTRRDLSIDRVRPPIMEILKDLPFDVTGLPATLLSPGEISITQATVEELLSDLASGRVTSSLVTNAFLRRAGVAQKLVNCITELLPERALERAKFLDDYRAKHNSPIGPLHGLPVSIKEHISMRGLTVTAAFISFHENIAPEDAHLLRILWNAGAVFYARTTEPQILMHLETSSNYYGTTVNPFNRNLTAGGSSGGEGALLGLRGSCLGVGSDIGGSIRAPSSNQGVYGLRPTAHRVPCEGNFATMLAQDHIAPVTGPMSTSLEGIKIFMKTVLDAKPWLTEPSLLPFPWNLSAIVAPSCKPLKIAVMWSDGVVKPHPPITRALSEVAARLSTLSNVTVVDWTPYRHDYAWSIIASLYFVDGGAEDIASLDSSGEPWMPLTKHILQNEWVKRLSIEGLWDWSSKRDQYRSAYARLWNSTGGKEVVGTEERDGTVDAIICPPGPGVAPLLGTAKWWGYTAQWNLLDYPCMVFPVSKVDVGKDLKEQGYTPMNERDRINYELYAPEAFSGAPISLQIVGRPYEDEKIIGIVEYLQKAIGLPWA